MDDLFIEAKAQGKSLRFGYDGSKDGHHKVRWATPVKLLAQEDGYQRWLCYDLTRRDLRQFRTDRTAQEVHAEGIFAPLMFDRPGNGYTEDGLPGYTQAAEVGLIPA